MHSLLGGVPWDLDVLAAEMSRVQGRTVALAPRAKAVAATLAPAKPARSPLPVCKWGPRLLTAKEKTANRVAGCKTWRWCDHPSPPTGNKVVAECTGCGPRCPGYTAPA